MSYEEILFDVACGVATVTLNRPDRINAISTRMRAEFEAVLATVKTDAAVRVVRVNAAGRGFCSGYELGGGESVYASVGAAAEPEPEPGTRSMAESAPSALVSDRERLRESIERWLAIWNFRKPLVAQVHGVCLSGGLDLIGVCDLVYAAEDARFGHPAARGLGIPPTMGMLPLKIGLARTKELFFTGDLVDGVRAERIGLVNEAVPTAELDARTMAVCRRIALNSGDALTLHKHVANRWAEVMNLRLAALEGAEFDALFHQTAASADFGRLAARDGLRAALAWRDDPYKNDPAQ